MVVYAVSEEPLSGARETGPAPSLAQTASRSDSELRGPARVIDGDTIEVVGERVRIHGIDAPESEQKCTWPDGEVACGRMSTAAMTDLVAGQTIRCDALDRDRYGRIIGRCFNADGHDIGRALVWAGWALAYRRYSDDYVGAEDAAREAGRGMWRGDFVEPWEWRRANR